MAGVALCLLWRIAAVNVSGLLAEPEDPAAPAEALRWDGRNSVALHGLGLGSMQDDPQAAQGYFESALANNPADGPSYAAVAEILEARGERAVAERAIMAAASMEPQRADVQLQIAGFWMRRGDPARAMSHLDVALSYDAALRETVFPDLLKLAEDPRSRDPSFTAILKQPLAWWPEFFNYAAARASRVDTLRALLQLQAAGPNGVKSAGLRAYLDRLQKEGLWIDAYIAWLNSLPKERLNAIDNLFNGDFEGEITNMGFDWIVTPAPQVAIETASTYGATGGKALRVLFRGSRIRFQNLRQHLMLDPGGYLLRGRVRPDNLDAPEGVRWVIYCQGRSKALAQSETFRGTDHWQYFSIRVEVPPDCPVQTLRLELAGRADLDFDAKGAIWFDDMSITRERLVD